MYSTYVSVAIVLPTNWCRIGVTVLYTVQYTVLYINDDDNNKPNSNDKHHNTTTTTTTTTNNNNNDSNAREWTLTDYEPRRQCHLQVVWRL